MSGDGVYHFAHLHSIVVDRDLDPVNEIRYFQREARSPYTGRPKIGNRPPRNPATGEVVNKYPIGLALLALPAYVAVYVVSHGLLSAAGVPADVSGYGWTLSVRVGSADCRLRGARLVVLSARRRRRARWTAPTRGGRRC